MAMVVRAPGRRRGGLCRRSARAFGHPGASARDRGSDDSRRPPQRPLRTGDRDSYRGGQRATPLRARGRGPRQPDAVARRRGGQPGAPAAGPPPRHHLSGAGGGDGAGGLVAGDTLVIRTGSLPVDLPTYVAGAPARAAGLSCLGPIRTALSSTTPGESSGIGDWTDGLDAQLPGPADGARTRRARCTRTPPIRRRGSSSTRWEM